MSYELDFWRYAPGLTLDHEKVCQQLCDGIALDALEHLPIAELLSRVNEEFSNWEKLDNVTFDGGDRGGFQLYTTPQFFRVDCYGMNSDDMNKFIEIANEFGCPLYDRQAGKRFD
jgi:hypothetical protein